MSFKNKEPSFGDFISCCSFKIYSICEINKLSFCAICDILIRHHFVHQLQKYTEIYKIMIQKSCSLCSLLSTLIEMDASISHACLPLSALFTSFPRPLIQISHTSEKANFIQLPKNLHIHCAAKEYAVFLGNLLKCSTWNAVETCFL